MVAMLMCPTSTMCGYRLPSPRGKGTELLMERTSAITSSAHRFVLFAVLLGIVAIACGDGDTRRDLPSGRVSVPNASSNGGSPALTADNPQLSERPNGPISGQRQQIYPEVFGFTDCASIEANSPEYYERSSDLVSSAVGLFADGCCKGYSRRRSTNICDREETQTQQAGSKQGDEGQPPLVSEHDGQLWYSCASSAETPLTPMTVPGNDELRCVACGELNQPCCDANLALGDDANERPYADNDGCVTGGVCASRSYTVAANGRGLSIAPPADGDAATGRFCVADQDSESGLGVGGPLSEDERKDACTRHTPLWQSGNTNNNDAAACITCIQDSAICGMCETGACIPLNADRQPLDAADCPKADANAPNTLKTLAIHCGSDPLW